MRTRLGILMAAVLGGVLALPASGQMMGQTGQGGPMGHMAGGMMGREMGPDMREGGEGTAGLNEGPLISIVLAHGQKLGLSPEQERKLRDLRTDFAKESIRRTAEIRVGEIELESLLEQGQWDLAKIEPQVKQIAGLQADLRLARLKTLEAGRRVLTPEQLEKVKTARSSDAGNEWPGHDGRRPADGTWNAGPEWSADAPAVAVSAPAGPSPAASAFAASRGVRCVWTEESWRNRNCPDSGKGAMEGRECSRPRLDIRRFSALDFVEWARYELPKIIEVLRGSRTRHWDRITGLQFVCKPKRPLELSQ